MRRSDVPKPALLVDIDILDRNAALMRDRAAAGLEELAALSIVRCSSMPPRITGWSRVAT